MIERARIEFLVQNRGVASARTWCLDTARTYRKVVLLRKTHTLYRRQLIRRYLELKRFALSGWAILMKCDKCDAPATTFARDTIQVDSQGGYECYEVGPPMAGCDKHPVKGRTIHQDEIR